MNFRDVVFLLIMLRYFLFCLYLGIQVIFAQSTTPPPPTYPSKFVVAQDGSGDYKTIQEAVNNFRDHSQVRVTLYIKNGVYHEKLVIPAWKPNIHLVGESKEGVIITGDDFSGKPYPNGAKDATGKDKFSTYTSFVVLVDAPDIVIENLTIQNTAGRVGQAVALHVEGDRFVCKNCKLIGNQDTLFAAREGSRQYYQNCYIAVSYTHLDVSKRQTFSRIVGNTELAWELSDTKNVGLDAVSYTHLDVYKRQVYGQSNEKRSPVANGVVLSPNQAATYYDDQKHFVTGLVEKPTLLETPETGKQELTFQFDDTPLSEVIRQLELAYGIDIVVENEQQNNCLLTADLSSQPLYNQLDLICASLKAKYEIQGTTILLSGKGCN